MHVRLPKLVSYNKHTFVQYFCALKLLLYESRRDKTERCITSVSVLPIRVDITVFWVQESEIFTFNQQFTFYK